MSTEILSIRIKSDLKKKMEELRHIDWRKEIEEFIERRIREEELRMAIETIEKTLSGATPSPESAWKSIREFREER